MACPSTPVQRTLGMSSREVSSSSGSLYSFFSSSVHFPLLQYVTNGQITMWEITVKQKPQKTALLEM